MESHRQHKTSHKNNGKMNKHDIRTTKITQRKSKEQKKLTTIGEESNMNDYKSMKRILKIIHAEKKNKGKIHMP